MDDTGRFRDKIAKATCWPYGDSFASRKKNTDLAFAHAALNDTLRAKTTQTEKSNTNHDQMGQVGCSSERCSAPASLKRPQVESTKT